MKADLIHRMHAETHRALSVIHKKEAKDSHRDPHCLYASQFIGQDKSVYMSFHQAASNAFVHYHDFFEMNYVLSGSPVASIDKHVQPLKTGSLCIMNPKATHSFISYIDEEDLILNVVIPTDLLKKSLFLPMLSDPVLNRFFLRYSIEHKNEDAFLYLDKPDSHIESIMEMLIEAYLSAESYTQTVMDALITLLFTYIFRHYKTPKTTKDQAISRVINEVYDTYQTCSLDQLAKKYNYHPKYLSQLIHHYSGYTLRELITHIRIKNGEQYLMYTDMTIEDIALTLGYRDKSSFFNSFKKRHGMTPGAYRHQHTESY